MKGIKVYIRDNSNKELAAIFAKLENQEKEILATLEIHDGQIPAILITQRPFVTTARALTAISTLIGYGLILPKGDWLYLTERGRELIAACNIVIHPTYAMQTTTTEDWTWA